MTVEWNKRLWDKDYKLMPRKMPGRDVLAASLSAGTIECTDCHRLAKWLIIEQTKKVWFWCGICGIGK